MAKYRFESLRAGYDVYYRGRRLGQIYPMKESTGRHCFYLGCDKRRQPRTYRGKLKAAEALHTIDRLLQEAKKKRWPLATTIVQAWDERPRASDQW